MVSNWWETEGVVDSELGRANAVRHEAAAAQRSLARAHSLLEFMTEQGEELDNWHQFDGLLRDLRAQLDGLREA